MNIHVETRTMEVTEEDLRNCLRKFSLEADKTIKLIVALKEKAQDIIARSDRISNPEHKNNERKKAVNDLEELTEKLVGINVDLEIDYITDKNYVIPYLCPGDGRIYDLKFLIGDNPWNFWLIDSNVDTKGILKDILHKFESNLLDPVKQPKAAQSVCFIDKNKVIRGIIIQIINENRIKIVDCDSNVTKIVTCDKLYKVDKETCCVHASALRCMISEEPVELELWKNSNLRELFCNTLRDATLGVKIVERFPGSFPMFVVDVQLQNEEEESEASLKEWILDRLVPAISKLDCSEDNPVCDFLTEDCLSPYYKEEPEIAVQNNDLQTLSGENNINTNQMESKTEEFKLNNLNHPIDKLTEKVVADASNESINKDTINSFENKEQKTFKMDVSSSSCKSSSKESLISNESSSTESTFKSKLNSNTEEFRPKFKKPNIPRFSKSSQNRRNQSQCEQYGTSSAADPCLVHPHMQPSYSPYNSPVVPVNNWSYQLPPTWPPVADPNMVVTKSNQVNVMAPEFVPRNIQQSQESNKVEIPKEPIILRKPLTLFNENESLLVIIAHVETPSEFYVHFLNKNNTYLDKLMNDMSEYYNERENLEFVSLREARNVLGKYCACKWPQDNLWYRVEVLDWTVSNNQVKVWFVDYGNTECVPLICLQPLTKSFEKLIICSQPCHLAQVHPVEKGQPWSKEAVDFFKSKVDNADPTHVYSITVVQACSGKAMKQNSMSVLLHDERKKKNPKSINDLLVEEGLAWSRSTMVDNASSVSSAVYHSTEEFSDNSLAPDCNITPLDSVTTDLPPKSSLDTATTLLSNPYSALDSVTTDLSPNSSFDTATTLLSPNSSSDIVIPLLLDSNPLFQTSTDLNKGPKLDEVFEDWDPRREDFESIRNNPALDTDDACVAVTGYSARDESRICKFYAKKGFCFKDVCLKDHSIPNPDGITTDRLEAYNDVFSSMDLPDLGETVRLKITNVFDVNLFYAHIEEKKGISTDEESKEEAETLTSLQEYMNSPENKMQMKRVVPGTLSVGELVLARDDYTDMWYRARVITAPSPEDPAEVMFVDYGTECIVSERDLRQIEPRYLYLPLQAIECSLANIEIDPSATLSNESRKNCRSLLQELLLNKVLTAKVYNCRSSDNALEIEAVLKSQEFGDIGEILVANGFAAEKHLDWDMKEIPSDKIIYYPG